MRVSRTGAVLAAVLASLGSIRSSQAQLVPQSVLPGLGADAARVVVDIEQPPWRSVVRVQTDAGLRCSGALVGLRLVLTAAHCLFGRGTGRVVRPSSVHVLTGYDHGEYAGHARALSIEIGTGFALGLDGRRLASSAADTDWAMLTLDAPLGPGRVLPLSRELPMAGAQTMLGGYEQDRAQVMLADVACRVIDVVRAGDALLLRHSCAATRGASGAPLLGQIPGLGWAVIGVASLAGVGAAGGYAVPAATIAARSSVLPPGGM